MARARARLLLCTLLCSGPVHAEVVDPAFSQSVVVAPASQAGTSGLAWAPDGSPRLFYTRQTGLVRVVQEGQLLATPFAVIKPVLTDNVETGVIGIAFDPNYLGNRYVYVFVTVSATEQQIIRYTDQNNVGVDKTVVLDGLPTRGVNHNGGGVGFGPDGKLYFAIGDLGNRTGDDDDLSTVAAKVARVNLDGSAVRDNPFHDGDGPNDDRIWARGFRNPFSFTWQPSTDRLWVNVTGAMYEQIFTPLAGDHAGWGLYQNNQPEGFIPPRIVYRSARSDRWDVAATGARREGDVTTITTNAPHGIRVGQKVTLAGVADASFDGVFFVEEVPAPNRLRYAQAGVDAESGGGVASTLLLGGALTAGTFWDSSAVPAEYRGNFFFGDYNSGNIARATFRENDAVVSSVDLWATTGSRMIDIAVGPDGNLYYGTFDGGIYRVTYTAPAQGLVVSHLHSRIVEGGSGGFSVRLALAPSDTVRVEVSRSAGDTDVMGGGALEFDSENWSVPQFVPITAGQDDDAAPDEAVFEVSSPGIATERAVVRVTDDDEIALVVDPASLTMVEGTRVTVNLSLTGPPSRLLTVRSRVVDGEVEIEEGAELTFEPSSWATAQSLTIAAPIVEEAGDRVALLMVEAGWLGVQQLEVDITDASEVAMGDGGAGGSASTAGAAHAGSGGPASDGGDAGMSEGGEPDGGASGEGPEGESEGGGCACRTPFERGGAIPSLVAALALLAGLFWRRRRV